MCRVLPAPFGLWFLRTSDAVVDVTGQRLDARQSDLPEAAELDRREAQSGSDRRSFSVSIEFTTKTLVADQLT
jgi:hypothetical protein